MNTLARILRKHPSVVRDVGAQPGDRVPLEAFYENLASVWRDEEEWVGEFDVVDRIYRRSGLDYPAWQAFADASLVLVEAAMWQRALEEAEVRDSYQSAEWVTFVPVASGWGVTLPEDSYRVRRLSLFSVPGGKGRSRAYRRVSIDMVRGSDPAVAATVSVGHCGFPVKAICAPGECRQCRLAKRVAEPPGLICVCLHADTKRW